MIRPGFYLGRAYLDKGFALNFTLYDKATDDKARGDYVKTGKVQEDCWPGTQARTLVLAKPLSRLGPWPATMKRACRYALAVAAWAACWGTALSAPSPNRRCRWWTGRSRRKPAAPGRSLFDRVFAVARGGGAEIELPFPFAALLARLDASCSMTRPTPCRRPSGF